MEYGQCWIHYSQQIQLKKQEKYLKNVWNNFYYASSYKLKVYDYLTMYAAGGKRHLREFDIDFIISKSML